MLKIMPTCNNWCIAEWVVTNLLWPMLALHSITYVPGCRSLMRPCPCLSAGWAGVMIKQWEFTAPLTSGYSDQRWDGSLIGLLTRPAHNTLHSTHDTQHITHDTHGTPNTLHISLNTWYTQHITHYTWYTQHITHYTLHMIHTTHCTQHITYDTHITPNTDCPNFSQFITHLYYCGWGHSNKHWTFESCFYCFRLHQTDFYKHFWQLRFLLARIDMTWGLFHEDNRYPSSASIAMASTMWPGNSQCGVRRGDKQAAAGGGHHGTTLCLYYQQIRNHG